MKTTDSANKECCMLLFNYSIYTLWFTQQESLGYFLIQKRNSATFKKNVSWMFLKRKKEREVLPRYQVYCHKNGTAISKLESKRIFSITESGLLKVRKSQFRMKDCHTILLVKTETSRNPVTLDSVLGAVQI